MITDKRENWQLLFQRIKKQKIKSWFSLGIFLDKLQQRRFSFIYKPKSFQKFSSFTKFLSNGSFAFATYDLGVDGVSIEISNYFKAFKKLFPFRFKACLLVGDFDDESEILKKEKGKIPIYKIPEAAGFEKWGEPYQFLYFHKLKRGGEIYNLLPSLIWKKSLIIIEKMLDIIIKENIRCFVLSNVASNPVNLSFTLAVVIISEILGIPVININHDFYWEDGKNPCERKKGERPGVRDHFFTNADLGEFFSIIKLLFPWRGRFWIQVNINKQQTETLIEKEGLNPNDVTEIATAIDPLEFKTLTFIQKEKVYNKLKLLFNSLKEDLIFFKPTDSQIGRQARKGQPLIIGWQKEFDFSPDSTLLFLQPTRIIKRKQIEKNFIVLKSLFQDKNFEKYLFQQKKKILLLVSGPIATGHFNYFQKLRKEIINFYRQLPLGLKEIFFVGFKFGKDDNENFLSRGLERLSIAELYGISDLVFLLSKTEGRGLPIIESASSGVPLVVNRFTPRRTYEEVVLGLKVFIYQDNGNQEMVKELIPFIISKKKREQLIRINRQVIKNRFTFEILKNQFVYILSKSWLQTNSDCQIRKISYQILRKLLNLRKNSVKEIIFGENKTYFPGYIPCGFLFYLKSLIDPSFFRIEQLDLKSRIFNFGRRLVDQVELSQKKRFLFFEAIEEIFRLTWGEEKTTIDHSFNYRNRTNKKYLFHQLTEYELEGAVVLLSQKIFGSQFDPFLKSGVKEKDFKAQFKLLKNYRSKWKWGKKLKFLFPETNSLNLDLFFKKAIYQPRDIVFFLNNSQDIIFDLKILTEELLTFQLKRGKPIKIYLVVSKKPFFNRICKNDLEIILRKSPFSLLRKYQRKKLIKILSIPFCSSGINFYHLNKKAKDILVSLKEKKGIVFSRGENNFISLDLLNIDSFRFGTVNSDQFSRFLGLAKNKSFFQYIPAGLRLVLNYPVPSQQLLEFNKSLKKTKNKKDSFWQKIKVRQDKTGEDLAESIDKVLKEGLVLQNDFSQRYHKTGFIFDKFAGKCQDGLPWTGAYFKFDYFQLKDKKKLKFEIIKGRKAEPLSQLITELESKKKRKILFGLNGGFILSNELVGKLGLTKEYLGIPLGLSIHQGKIFSLPLYNRPVFGFKKNGNVFIKRLALPPGEIWMKVDKKQSFISWEKEQINPLSVKLPAKKIAVYNLLFGQKAPLNNRVLVTICGNKIAKVLRARFKKSVFCQKELLPVGITLSFPEEVYDKRFANFYQVGRQVNFAFKQRKEWQEVEEAIEAGPLLLKNGKISLKMKLEGWLTNHSITTQASRLDRLNQRGPKIALGISRKGEIIGVVFNGRTRDSFGVTYLEMAKILQNMGAWQAMAFDPGGSASLYIKGKLFNVPPYNPDYNHKIYYASAFPRPVANAVVLTIKSK